MDWAQTFTIISTMVVALYAFYCIMKEDIKRHDEQFARMNEEFSKRDTLWATLLQKIYDVNEKFYALEKQIYGIKLDQAKKD